VWLVLHQIDLVNVESLARTEERNNDGETDSGFRCGYDHHEENENLSGHLVPHVAEGDEGKVHGVEHELNRHEDGDHIALDKKGAGTDGKENRGEYKVAGNGDHLDVLLFALGERDDDSGAENSNEDEEHTGE
jgi:hypothetical protein